LPVQKLTGGDVQQLNKEWREVHNKSDRKSVISRIPRSVAFLITTLLRVRYLGAMWQAQGRLNEALVKRQDELDRNLEELTKQYGELENKLKLSSPKPDHQSQN